MTLVQSDYVIDVSIDGGKSWQHARTIPGWVLGDDLALRLQRDTVRRLAREEYGDGTGNIRTRVLREDDPRAAGNQPVTPDPVPDACGQYPDDARITLTRLQLVQVLADEGLTVSGTGRGDQVFGALLKRTVADRVARFEGRPEGRPL
jgi:hypothetical protein